MEHKAFETKVIEADDRTVTGISAVMGVVDAGNDLIFKGAFKKTIGDRGERVKHLWQHDFRMPPIATIVEMKEVGRTELPDEMKRKYPDAKGGLLVKRRYLDTERGNEVLAGLKADPPAITEMSFGYDAIKYDYEEIDAGDKGNILVRNLREVRLWDTSDVNWGMNEATVAVMKSALPWEDTGVADASKEWGVEQVKFLFEKDEFRELEENERKRIAQHYAWTKKNPPVDLGDMRFLHHEVSKSGEVGKVVLNGVLAAMKELAQADPQIPYADRKDVYTHLAKHLEQFDVQPPAYAVLELYWSVGTAIKVLSADPQADFGKISFDPTGVLNQLNAVNDLLRAEPKTVNALLTQQQLKVGLELRKRKLQQIIG